MEGENGTVSLQPSLLEKGSLQGLKVVNARSAVLSRQGADGEGLPRQNRSFQEGFAPFSE